MESCKCVTQINDLIAKEMPGLAVSCSIHLGGPLAGRAIPEIGLYWTANPESRKKRPSITPAYCPFCGQKYIEDNTGLATDGTPRPDAQAGRRSDSCLDQIDVPDIDVG